MAVAPSEAGLEFVRRQVGEEDLAQAGGVGLQALAHFGLEADGMGAIDLVEVDVLQAVEDGKLDRLVDLADDGLHRPVRFAEEVLVAEVGLAVLPDADAEGVDMALGVVGDVAPAGEGGEEAVEAALGEIELAADLGEAQPLGAAASTSTISSTRAADLTGARSETSAVGVAPGDASDVPFMALSIPARLPASCSQG